MNMEWYYLPANGSEETLLSANVRMLSYDGCGLLRREPQSTRMPLMDGVHHLDDEIYEPERYIHLVVEIVGTDYSDWKDEDDAFLDKLIGFQETNEMGLLRIVKPNGDQRYIYCSLLEYPNDHDMSQSPTASKRILTFYAPKPYFFTTELTETAFNQAIDGALSGYLYPAIFPWGSYGAMNYLTKTFTNLGNARSYPFFRLWGPATNPIFYNATTQKWVQIPVTLTLGQYLWLYMEEGYWTVLPDPLAPDENRTYVLGSTLWDLQVGENTVLIIAGDLAQNSHSCFHYEQWKAL